MEKINEQNNLYEQFLKYSYKDLKELFKKAKTKEEMLQIVYTKNGQLFWEAELYGRV